MLNITLFGPPGAGKGTQSIRLVERYELIHISPGEILREHIRVGSSLGKSIQYFLTRGELVPDDFVIELVADKIMRTPKSKGFLFDGYPRTLLQAEALDKQLSNNSNKLTMALFLQVRRDEVFRRIRIRRMELNREDDQSDEQIETRIDFYNKSTLPVKSHYEKQKKLIYVAGEGDQKEIHNIIAGSIQKLYKPSTKIVY